MAKTRPVDDGKGRKSTPSASEPLMEGYPQNVDTVWPSQGGQRDRPKERRGSPPDRPAQDRPSDRPKDGSKQGGQ